MRELYTHTFPNKDKVTLIVESKNGTLLFGSPLIPILPENDAEYERWRDEVVLPDLITKLSPEDMRVIALHWLKNFEDPQ